jgi:FkbM family methyltransferase
LNLLPTDYIDAHFLVSGYYESEIIEALLPFLTPGAVFWDIGANFGFHSVTAKYLRPSIHVVAFEPNPAMLSRIAQNAAYNDLNITVAPIALGKKTSKRILHVVGTGNSGMSTLHPLENFPYTHSMNIDCASGQELVEEGTYPPPSVIKLDVEGAESEVIAGLGNLLNSSSLQAVIFEAEMGLDLEDRNHPVLGPLLACRFKARPLFRKESTQHALANFIALRE